MERDCHANRPGAAPRAPGSSDSRQMEPQSKMAYGRLWLFCGLEKTTSPLTSAGQLPATTSSSKSRCGAVVSDAGTGTGTPSVQRWFTVFTTVVDPPPGPGLRRTMDATLEQTIRDRIEVEKARTATAGRRRARPAHPDRAVHRSGLPRVGEGADLRPQLAVRRPRVRVARARLLPPDDPLGGTDRGGAGRGRRAAGLLQRLSPPWRPGHPGRVRDRSPPDLPVPLLVLRHRRRPQGRSRFPQLRRPRHRGVGPGPGAL